MSMEDFVEPGQVVLLQNRVTHAQLRRAAEFLGVPYGDLNDRRLDGSLWWEKPAYHQSNTSHAGIAEQDGVVLFHDVDAAFVRAMSDHPVWEAIGRCVAR